MVYEASNFVQSNPVSLASWTNTLCKTLCSITIIASIWFGTVFAFPLCLEPLSFIAIVEVLFLNSSQPLDFQIIVLDFAIMVILIRVSRFKSAIH